MQAVATDKAPAAIGPYVQAMKIGDLVYTSGAIPLTAAGEQVTGDIKAQTNQVFDNLEAVLAEAGTALGNVVKATVFLKDLADFVPFNETYAERFGDHKPARSCVQVAKLPLDVAVEIEVIATL